MWLAVIHEPAVDSLNTSFMAVGSSPAATPSTSPSSVAWNVIAVTVLLIDFIMCPDPSGPRWNTAPAEHVEQRAGTRHVVASAPPTMNTSSAACAPHWAPETGASTIATPTAASASAVSA